MNTIEGSVGSGRHIPCADRTGATGAAQAHPNAALVKFWGKRNSVLNIPATSSLSMTMGDFVTRTHVTLIEDADQDELFVNGQRVELALSLRVCRFLDLIRREAGVQGSARVVTESNFPAASGLASAAAGFAALSLAACRALGLNPSPSELARLARRGSASASRSIHGGFTEMRVGTRADGLDTLAQQLAPPTHWDLRAAIAITRELPQDLSTAESMIRAAETSPYYPAWLASHEADMAAARQAILTRDLEALGTVIEQSTLKMHGAIFASNPSFLFWNGATVEVGHAIRRLRRAGVPAYFSVDAGPHVKVICSPPAVEQVVETLTAIPGVLRVLTTGVGGPARLIDEIR